MNADSMARLTALMTRPYKYLRLEWSAELGALRVRTYVKPIQCYSLAGLTEMQRVLSRARATQWMSREEAALLRFFDQRPSMAIAA